MPPYPGPSPIFGPTGQLGAEGNKHPSTPPIPLLQPIDAMPKHDSLQASTVHERVFCLQADSDALDLAFWLVRPSCFASPIANTGLLFPEN